MTSPTAAGVQATLRQAATVLRQVGWTQGQLVDELGRVDLRQALHLAADGDLLAERYAVHAVEDHLGFRDLVVWNDHPDRSRDQVLELLQRVAAVSLASEGGPVATPSTHQTGVAAGDPQPGSHAVPTPSPRMRLATARRSWFGALTADALR